jgi:hypothetical protein
MQVIREADALSTKDEVFPALPERLPGSHRRFPVAGVALPPVPPPHGDWDTAAVIPTLPFTDDVTSPASEDSPDRVPYRRKCHENRLPQRGG